MKSSQKFPQKDGRKAVRSDLPDDVVIGILSRLPVNDVLKFRRVCRRWRDLISTQYFAEIHVKDSSSPMILVHDKFPSNDELLVLDKWGPPRKRAKIQKLSFDFLSARFHFHLSYDGLIVVNGYNHIRGSGDFIIFNPVLLDKVRISRIQPPGSKTDPGLYKYPWFTHRTFEIYGMYFNASIKEYCLLWGLFETGRPVQFKLLNLGAEPCFRDLKQQPNSVMHKPRFPGRYPPVVIDDSALYWLVMSSYSPRTGGFGEYPSCEELIMAFDTRTEEFTFMPHPGPRNDCQSGPMFDCQNWWHWNMHIVKMDGHLSFLKSTITNNSFIINIWKLQDSVTRLWIRSQSVAVDIGPDIFVGLRGIFAVTAVGNGELLLAVGNGKRTLLYSYEIVYSVNLELRTIRRIGRKYKNVNLSTYVPSFISLRNCKSEIEI